MKLSGNQQRVLDVIESSGPIDGPELARLLGTTHPQSPQGIHQTAASLVRHGLVSKTRVRGIVHYERTRT